MALDSSQLAQALDSLRNPQKTKYGTPIMIPKFIGRYEIRGQLGQGGMGSVYLAYDPNFAREVAIKVLPQHFLHDSTFLKRFRQEAQTIAALEHFAVVQVYDSGEHNGQPFLVMRLMKGGSLADRLAKGTLSLAEAAHILAVLAPTLDEAHRRGIIHRDLKPRNILFNQQNEPRIADFGIAKFTLSTQSFTTGSIMGTAKYMSPEQWEGVPLDGRCDVYALGVILFQMLTGQCPYSGINPVSIMAKHVMKPVPNILSLREDLPPAIQPIIEQAMAKEREHRYPTASAFSQALQQLLIPPTEKVPTNHLSHQPPTHQPPIPPIHQSTPKWILGTLGVLALTVVSLLIIIAVGISGSNNPPAEPAIVQATNETTIPAPIDPTNEPTNTPIPPTNDPIPPTHTPTNTPTPIPPTHTPEPTIPPSTDPIISEKDGMRLLYVPEGHFPMGSAEDDPDAEDDEKPLHTVFLSAFWIDQTEVTNAMFAKFVAETGHQTEAEKEGWAWAYTGSDWEEVEGADWQHPQGPESDLTGLESHPVVQVSWDDATAYCQWAGRRLPTEAEWEKAAGGTDSRKWPWGNKPPDENLANVSNYVGGTTPVGSYSAGASPYGALDMAGNVWEWTGDSWEESYYASSPNDNSQGAMSQLDKVVRGGSWNVSVHFSRARYRFPLEANVCDSDRGFRCATSEP